MKKLILLFSSLFIVVVSLAQIPTDGLVAWYPFNGNANDESGNGNDGTVNGAVLTTDRFGNDNSAYNFDGISAYIACTDAFMPANDQSRTFTFWVNYYTCLDPPPWYGWGTALSYGTYGSNNGCNALLEDDGRLCFHLCDYGAYSVPEDILGEWHFIVMVYDMQTDSVKFFIDTFINSSVYLNLPPNTILSGQLFFGQLIFNDNASYHLNGKLDDIRVYDRTLSDAEINTLYHEGGWLIQATILSTIENQQICKNDSTSFEVKADGILPLYYQWQKDGADIIGATDSVLTIPQVQPEDAGQYRCIATNEYGVDTSNTALLTVEFTVPTFILGDITATLFQVATYSVNASEGHTYEFMVEGGIKVDGTDNSITVHWNTAGMGYVKLIEMSELGCYADTNTLEVNVGYSGIADQEVQHLSVYPNPSSSAITFCYALDEPSQVTLQIYNLYGQQMDYLINEYQQKGNHHFSWNVAGLPSGIYFYRLSTGKQSSTGKMTVVR